MAITTIDGPPTVRLEAGETTGRSTSTQTVLFVDAASRTLLNDSSQTTSGKTRNRRFDEIVGLLQSHNGTVVKAIGSSLMVEFSEPVSAVRSAIEIERHLQQSSLAYPRESQLEVRIGIHASAASSSGIDAFGELVNDAATITKRAVAGQILISRSVHEAISREPDLHCQWMDKLSIDGRPGQDIFEVSWAEAPENIPARYEVLSHIGTGGMGMVYKVRDLQTNEIVALKVLKPSMASDPGMQENLRKEVCLARKVTHKNVCRIYEFNRSNGTACISMEFIEGESLSSRLRRNGPLPLEEALEITRQICAGLREAHSQAIVHRDLKPANIIVDRNGSVRIMDFGIARLVREDSQMTGTIAGTPAYMAPEQIELRKVDGRTDIYAVGLLMYEMITGYPTVSGDSPIAAAVKQLHEVPKRPREFVPELPTQIEAVILKCLQKDPEKRFQSVDEVEAALTQEPGTRRIAILWPAVASRLQTTGVQIKEAVRRGVQEAKPAVAAFASKAQEISLEAKRAAVALAGKTKTYLQQQDWRALATARPQQALAGLGLVIVLGCAIAFALGRGGNNKLASAQNSANAQNALATDQVAGLNPTATDAVDDSVAPPTHPVDLNHDANASSFKAAASEPAPKKATARPARSESVSSKSHVAAVTPAASSATTATAVAVQTADISVDTALAAPAPDATAATPVKPADATPSAAAQYLEVGTSKDAAWADSAVETLSKLGFHAVSKHKGRLFLQSYHVEVGPYTDTKDLEAAEQALAAHGFKSHVVK